MACRSRSSFAFAPLALQVLLPSLMAAMLISSEFFPSRAITPIMMEVRGNLKTPLQQIDNNRGSSCTNPFLRNSFTPPIFHSTTDTLYLTLCMCCHPIYSGRQSCRRTIRRHTGGRSHRISPRLPSAVLVVFFLAGRIQPSLSLVDREVILCAVAK